MQPMEALVNLRLRARRPSPTGGGCVNCRASNRPAPLRPGRRPRWNLLRILGRLNRDAQARGGGDGLVAGPGQTGPIPQPFDARRSFSIHAEAPRKMLLLCSRPR